MNTDRTLGRFHVSDVDDFPKGVPNKVVPNKVVPQTNSIQLFDIVSPSSLRSYTADQLLHELTRRIMTKDTKIKELQSEIESLRNQLNDKNVYE